MSEDKNLIINESIYDSSQKNTEYSSKSRYQSYQSSRPTNENRNYREHQFRPTDNYVKFDRRNNPSDLPSGNPDTTSTQKKTEHWRPSTVVRNLTASTDNNWRKPTENNTMYRKINLD